MGGEYFHGGPRKGPPYPPKVRSAPAEPWRSSVTVITVVLPSRASPFGNRRATCHHPSAMADRAGVKNWFKVRFIAGIFVTLPIFVTCWILWIFWSKIDDFFAPMYFQLFGRVV